MFGVEYLSVDDEDVSGRVRVFGMGKGASQGERSRG